MKTNFYYFFFYLLLLISCSNDITDDGFDDGPNGNNEWTITKSGIRDGGPGKDGIPSIDDPIFISANNVDFLSDTDLVIGVIENNIPKAFPHIILDWHEIVNDNSFALNYCPLTGTAFAWENVVNGLETTFGVSGLLYNANLILYDRFTNSNWSQLKLECVNGPRINDKPKLFDVVETDWKTWKTLYPDTQVLDTQTGFSRTYGTSPYGDYSVRNERFIFTPSIINPALPNKDRVFAIIDNDVAKVYQFSNFTNGKAIRDTFNGNDYLIVGNENLICGFKLEGDFSNLTFEYDFNFSESFFKDNEGNKWSVFGKNIEGPRDGQSLSSIKSVMSYWFAIAVFYPNPEIYAEL